MAISVASKDTALDKNARVGGNASAAACGERALVSSSRLAKSTVLAPKLRNNSW